LLQRLTRQKVVLRRCVPGVAFPHIGSHSKRALDVT
jgi:hypothetical protein